MRVGVLAGVWVADVTAVADIMMVAGGAMVVGGSVGASETVTAGSVSIVNVSGDGRTAVGFRGAPLSTSGAQAGKIQSKTITKQGNSLFMTDFPREL